MIDYLSFSDNTKLIIIDIHTSIFRSIFALLQCLCHCRPWIIQNYKIMSLFLTRCCACLYLYSFLYLYFSKIYPMVVWEMRRSRVFLKCSIVVFPTNASETLSAKSTLLTGHRRQLGWGWCGKHFEKIWAILAVQTWWWWLRWHWRLVMIWTECGWWFSFHRLMVPSPQLLIYKKIHRW